ncbi:hypothetical protein ZIOFF_031982 [Zingiber officinale]|uniref:Bidirectional sugar transporter SWEET n=1 Tax=Zingiber officinale TaxID=94328 RepID=A0A8J5GN57_ZINOF|nr:hypothetical protein ZIOFF_031982 [Zingiber officinale]
MWMHCELSYTATAFRPCSFLLSLLDLFQLPRKEREKKLSWIEDAGYYNSKPCSNLGGTHRTDFFCSRSGNLISGMVVVSPVPTFYRIFKNKSTESFDSFPYTLFFSCLIQVYTMKLILLINLGIFGSLLLISNLFIKESKRDQITGGICASLAVAVFIAPLTIIRQVIRTKSVEYMPVSLSIFLTLSAVAWFSYGVLLGDLFVAIPNVFGFLLGVGQIIIYLMYMNHDKERCSKIGNQGTEAPADMEVPEAKSNSCELAQVQPHV